MAHQLEDLEVPRRRARPSCSRQSRRQASVGIAACACFTLAAPAIIPAAEAWSPVRLPLFISPAVRGTTRSDPVSMSFDEGFSQRQLWRSDVTKRALYDRRVVGGVGRAASRVGCWHPIVPPLMSLAEDESGPEKSGYNPVLGALTIAGLGAIFYGLRDHTGDGTPASFGAVWDIVKAGPTTVTAAVQGFLRSSFAKVEELGPLGPLYFGGLYVLAEVLIIPALPLTTTAGFLFGVPAGTAIVLISATIAAVISFQLGRTLLRKQVEALLEENPKFRAIDKAIAKEGFKIILLLRLTPIFPFALSNYLYGVTSVDFLEFMGGTLLGFFPGTLAYVYGGTLGKGIMDGQGMALPWYSNVAVIVFVAFLLKTVGDIATNAIEEIEPGLREE